MKKAPEIETAAIRRATVLSVGPSDADGSSLEHIFHEPAWGVYTYSEWTLIARPTLDAAFSVLREALVPIVLCEADLLPGTWREILEHISFLPDPPLLIVTSRLADERMWAEVLNEGGYDVLAKPFDMEEVIRTFTLAWQHWQDRHDLHSSRTKQRQATGAPTGRETEGGEAVIRETGPANVHRAWLSSRLRSG